MPNFDGTGPMGRGSGTGRAMGPCGAGRGAVYYGRGCGRAYGGAYGQGFGRGGMSGRGFMRPGWGRNSPRSAGFFDAGESGSEDRSEFTLNALKRSQELLEQELAMVNRAISEAESGEDKTQE